MEFAKKGDPIALSAGEWNAVAARANKTIRSDNVNYEVSGDPNIVLVKNKSDKKIRQFTPLNIGEMIVQKNEEGKISNPFNLDNNLFFECDKITTGIELSNLIDTIDTVKYHYPEYKYDGYKYLRVGIALDEIEPEKIGYAQINGACPVWSREVYNETDRLREKSIKWVQPSPYTDSSSPVWFDRPYQPYYGVINDKQYLQAINIGEWVKLRKKVTQLDGYKYNETQWEFLVSSLPLFEIITQTDMTASVDEKPCRLTIMRFMNELSTYNIKDFD